VATYLAVVDRTQEVDESNNTRDAEEQLPLTAAGAGQSVIQTYRFRSCHKSTAVAEQSMSSMSPST
jgi:hypothetical protein